MSDIAWGERIDAPTAVGPETGYLSVLAQACTEHPSFKFVEWRRVTFSDGASAEYLIVEARDGGWAPRVDGIRRVERLALSFLPHMQMPLDVRALRDSFPDVLHLNAVPAGDPKSLCLYAETWASVERTWTAYGHLERVLWWLRKTADGTLHEVDQPLEATFYGTNVFVILPRRAQKPLTDASAPLTLSVVSGTGTSRVVVRGQYGDGTPQQHDKYLDIIDIVVPAANADFIRRFPPHLTALHDDFVAMGSELLPVLRDIITKRVGTDGLERRARDARVATLVVLHIPRLRNGEMDSAEVRGFVVWTDLASLGEACGALFEAPHNHRFYADIDLIPASAEAHSAIRDACANLSVAPVDVSFELDAPAARAYSGVDEESGMFRGVLLGVGALGSLLAELWAREGWGQWDYVDGDILLSHNTVRHVGKSICLGMPKAEIVKHVVGFSDAKDTTRGRAFVETFEHPQGELAKAVREAALVVDATTTLHVPRDAMDDDALPRMASVFLTPNGQACVMLLDSADRSVRVAHLEAQYYRAMLRSSWGANHLDGHAGIDIGAASCRRASATLSYELIHVHGGTLSGQLRRNADGPDARLLVWSLDTQTGALHAERTAAVPALTARLGDWRVVWDEGVEACMRAQRETHLPHETGGILLGYLDQKLKVVFVVDALRAPKDSRADPTGFTRGKLGVRESIEEARRRTTGVVDYIGEWHSHPKGHSARPSDLDVVLLAQLAMLRAREQLPTLMLIAGEGPVSVSFAHSPEATHDGRA